METTTRNKNLPATVKPGKPRDFIYNYDSYYVGARALPEECYHSTEIFFIDQAYCNQLLRRQTTSEKIIKMQIFILRMRNHIDDIIQQKLSDIRWDHPEITEQELDTEEKAVRKNILRCMKKQIEEGRSTEIAKGKWAYFSFEFVKKYDEPYIEKLKTYMNSTNERVLNWTEKDVWQDIFQGLGLQE